MTYKVTGLDISKGFDKQYPFSSLLKTMSILVDNLEDFQQGVPANMNGNFDVESGTGKYDYMVRVIYEEPIEFPDEENLLKFIETLNDLRHDHDLYVDLQIVLDGTYE